MPKPANTSKRTTKKMDTSNASGVQPEQDTTVRSERQQLLEKAAEYVLRDRNSTYGAPEKSFQTIAAFWTILFGIPIQSHQVAIALDLLKTARLMSSPGHFDTWVDKAGYSACGWECSVEESKRARGTQQ